MLEAEQPDPLNAVLDEICRQAKSPKQAATVLDRVLQDVVQPHHQGMFWGDRMLTLDKAAAFRADERFRAALAEADSSTGQNQYASPDGVSWRYNTLIWAARSCLALPGDYVECGVYCGDMTWMITETVDLRGAGKAFYLYDTFAGFDPKYSSEADFPESPQFFNIAMSAYKVSNLDVRVRDRFATKPYVVIVKGTVPDVLYVVAPTKIAFLHLDMNSPAAERGALDVLFDRVSPGGIVVFDDYGWTLFGKQKHEADAFAASRGNVILELPTGQGLMIKR
jgi:O-methyltransferase